MAAQMWNCECDTNSEARRAAQGADLGPLERGVSPTHWVNWTSHAKHYSPASAERSTPANVQGSLPTTRQA